MSFATPRRTPGCEPPGIPAPGAPPAAGRVQPGHCRRRGGGSRMGGGSGAWPVHVLVEQLRGGGELDGLALLLGALAPGAHGGPDLAAVALEDDRHPSGRGPVLEPRRPGRGEAAAHLARGELGEDAGNLLRGELLPEHRDRAGRGPHQRGRARLEHQLGSLLPDETLEDWIQPGHEDRVYVKPPRCSPCWQAAARSGRSAAHGPTARGTGRCRRAASRQGPPSGCRCPRRGGRGASGVGRSPQWGTRCATDRICFSASCAPTHPTSSDRYRYTGEAGEELKSPQTTNGSPSAWAWTKVDSFLASMSWFSPKPIFSFSLQNSRVKGVGRLRWVLKTWNARPAGVASFMWAQIRLCLVSLSRSTW